MKACFVMWPWCQVTRMMPSLCIESWWPLPVIISRLCSQVGCLFELCIHVTTIWKICVQVFLISKVHSGLLVCVFIRRNSFKRNIQRVSVVVGGVFKLEKCMYLFHTSVLLYFTAPPPPPDTYMNGHQRLWVPLLQSFIHQKIRSDRRTLV